VETDRELLDYLREHRWALVEFLMRLALVESPSSEPERQREVLSILSGALGELDSWCVAFRVA
jgi:hypothetical protein